MLSEEQMREQYEAHCRNIGIFQDEETWEIWVYQQRKIDRLKIQLSEALDNA